MFAFIARQPILDIDKDVFAYELLFRDGVNNSYPSIEKSEATNKLLTQNCRTLALDEISCSKKSFINFQPETLLQKLHSSLNPENVVVELSTDGDPVTSLLDSCKQVKEMGFTIAIDNCRVESQWSKILPFIDMVKVDTSKSNVTHISENLKQFVDANVRLIADKVNTHDDFNICRDVGFDYFQGYFFSKPESIPHQNLPTSKLTLIELMGASSSATFDVENINRVIEHDVGLSYMLLRFINNPTINKRYKITSLRHALNYMGEVEIKKFIALLALTNLSDDKPLELLHLSLVRAKFCDLIGVEKNLGNNPPTAFLVGLFSMLDALLDQDMQILMEKLPLIEDVKVALCGGQNELSMYLMLVQAFESGNWLKVIRSAKILDLEQKLLHSLFNEAILWGNGVKRSISRHFPESKV
ncbi:EAL domain-containing protein [Paraglaciecola aquimarina]|uniref:EAL domain-containing protein n=1 Tax=Paraglaciecola aquimarina TaxID=1235557 RepID=A0ABU3SSD1_9ALTE|nr:HDOD domain-containing protein [Paraglaciecola aquimarina]MDU0352882.1 EAL domain-containing protein [Paraglaciecola aquimarina]